MASFSFSEMIAILSLISLGYVFSTPTVKTSLYFDLIHPYKVHQNNSMIFPEKMSLISNLDPTPFGYYIRFRVGQPALEQIVAIDSGSPLFWIPCKPCNNCPLGTHLTYNPVESPTRSTIYCDWKYCKGDWLGCGVNKTCDYHVGYADKSHTKGVLIQDNFYFSTFIRIPNLIFGCGHENEGEGLRLGIMGLSVHPVSIIAQFGYKFSYCTGLYNDPSDAHSFLIIGEDSIFEGNSTPLEIHELYYIKMEGITINNKFIEGPPPLDTNIDTQFNFIIDSGTPYSRLNARVYNQLLIAVESVVDERLKEYPTDGTVLCYYGDIEQDAHWFPMIQFQFEGNASFEVGAVGLFHQHGQNEDKYFCMSFRPVGRYEENIFGSIVQQFHNIGYDIPGKTLYFERVDCQEAKNSRRLGL